MKSGVELGLAAVNAREQFERSNLDRAFHPGLVSGSAKEYAPSPGSTRTSAASAPSSEPNQRSCEDIEEMSLMPTRPPGPRGEHSASSTTRPGRRTCSDS